MYIIVGLGNPGAQYEHTRHNIGFEVIERFATDNRISVEQKKHRALIGQGSYEGEKVLLVMPQTYMNLSGEALQQVLAFYKADKNKIIVVYDDISLGVGEMRIRKKGSAGGHNGIKNIIQHLGSDEFIRIKVGVGEKPAGWDLARYVLSRFEKNEIEEMANSVERASRALEMIIKDGTDKAMNNFN